MEKNHDIELIMLRLFIEHVLSVKCIIYTPHGEPAFRNY